jgi:hypothetical protein
MEGLRPMRGFLAYVSGCATVGVLTLIHPDSARWFALAILGVLFVASAIPRRKNADDCQAFGDWYVENYAQPSAEVGGKPSRETGASLR